jgi:hypothetical protein
MGRAGLDDGLEGQSVGIALAVREVMKENERLIGLIARLVFLFLCIFNFII